MPRTSFLQAWLCRRKASPVDGLWFKCTHVRERAHARVRCRVERAAATGHIGGRLCVSVRGRSRDDVRERACASGLCGQVAVAADLQSLAQNERRTTNQSASVHHGGSGIRG